MSSTEPSEDAVDAVVAHVSEDVVVWASDHPHPDTTFPGAVTTTLGAMRQLPQETPAPGFSEPTPCGSMG